MKKFMMLMIAAITISSVSVFAQEKAGKKDTTQQYGFVLMSYASECN
jgi:hypothetical protein